MGKKNKKNYKAEQPMINKVELGEMLDGIASTMKAVSMLGNQSDAKIVVTTFEEQVVLPQAVVGEISLVLQKYVEQQKPIIKLLAAGVKQ